MVNDNKKDPVLCAHFQSIFGDQTLPSILKQILKLIFMIVFLSFESILHLKNQPVFKITQLVFLFIFAFLYVFINLSASMALQ